MASISSVLMAFLIHLILDHTGTRGDSVSVFTCAGGAATLPCVDLISQAATCPSTSWTYSRTRRAVVEKVTHGKIREDNTHRAERLSLHPNCSLHITDVTTEDAGRYACRQHLREDEPAAAPVYLSVLQVTAEVEAGSHVTLHCQLHSDGNCAATMADRGVNLSWVDAAGVELQNTKDRQINTTSICSISLTEELRDPSPVPTQRTWRCQLTAGGQLNTVAIYPVGETGVTTGATAPSKSTGPGICGAVSVAAIFPLVVTMTIVT